MNREMFLNRIAMVLERLTIVFVTALAMMVPLAAAVCAMCLLNNDHVFWSLFLGLIGLAILFIEYEFADDVLNILTELHWRYGAALNKWHPIKKIKEMIKLCAKNLRISWQK